MSSASEVELVLKKGAFSLKGVTISGSDHSTSLTNLDGVSMNSLCKKWFSKEDKISLNCSDPNFGKKCTGKRPPDIENLIPSLNVWVRSQTFMTCKV